MSDVLIRVEGVSKKYCRSLKRSLWYGVRDSFAALVGASASACLRPDEFWAVRDVSFEVRRGECLGLIGRNGAGKTTLLKMLNGLIKPDMGRIEMRGRVGALIALGAGFNPILTGRENIYVNGSVLGLTRKEIDRKLDAIVDFAEIEEFIDSPVQGYSSGMAVRLGFAVAASVESDILLLDEVLAVGDIRFQAKCFNTLAEFRKRGTAFILVSHNMHMISRYCQQVLYLCNGHVQHLGEVSAGIAQQAKDLETGPNPEVYGTKIVPRGSGKIRFTEAQFLDRGDDPVTQINVGDAVTFVIGYERYDHTLSSAVLDVSIRDNNELLYQDRRQFTNLHGRGQLRVMFAYLPSSVEHLDFTVTLLNSLTSEILDWKDDLQLHLRRDAAPQGRLLLPADWTMVPLAARVPIREEVIG